MIILKRTLMEKVIQSIKLHQTISLHFDKDRTNHMLIICGQNIMLNDVSDILNTKMSI